MCLPRLHQTNPLISLVSFIFLLSRPLTHACLLASLDASPCLVDQCMPVYLSNASRTWLAWVAVLLVCSSYFILSFLSFWVTWSFLFTRNSVLLAVYFGSLFDDFGTMALMRSTDLRILFLQCRKYQACRTTNATKGPINRTLLKISIVTRNENKPRQNATELFPAPQHETQKVIEISRCIAVSPNNFIFRWFFQTTPFFLFCRFIYRRISSLDFKQGNLESPCSIISTI